MAINDYDEKFKAIASIINAPTLRDVFKKIEIAALKKRLHFNGDSAYEASHKWKPNSKKSSNPSNTYQHFFTVLLEEIGASNLDQDSFVNCSYAEFIQSLPEKNKQKIGQYSSEKEQSIKNIYDEKNRHQEHIVIFSEHFKSALDTNKVQTDKKIDQKHIYLTPYVKNEWKEVIDSREHDVYELCRKSLDELLDSPGWEKFLEKRKDNLKRIVFLGAGGGEKERIIVREMAKCTNSKFEIVFVDASTSMLELSCENIKDYFRLIRRNQQWSFKQDFIPIKLLRADFTELYKLSEFPACNQHSIEGHSIYFLLGGAFGNNDENVFLESIKQIMCDEDLLIINAEFFEVDNQEEYEEKIKEDYLKSELMSFVMASLLPYLMNDWLRDKSVEEIQKNIDCRIFTDKATCPVPKSIAVARELNVELPNGNIDSIRISIAKKYVRETLLQYFKERGFETVEGLSNSNQISIKLKRDNQEEAYKSEATSNSTAPQSKMTAQGEAEKNGAASPAVSTLNNN